MSKILFLTSVYDYYDKGNLNVDLVDTFAQKGHEIVVLTPKERKYKLKERLEHYGNITALQFNCLNFRGKVNPVEKGLSTLLMGYQYRHALKKYFKSDSFDVLIYTTMPITYAPIIRYVKHTSNAFCYLLQKDFFPQSAVDLGMLKKQSIIYNVFRSMEKNLFILSDKIGLISERNVEYLNRENAYLDPNKAEYCPNSIIPTPSERLIEYSKRRDTIREKYNIPTDDVVFLYGGNISRAQGIDFVKELFSYLQKNRIGNAYFLVVGNGNRYEELRQHIVQLNSDFISIFPFLPKQEYDELLSAVDVGMVFLDKRFTIANIPSRTLSHMDMGQPIVAATDSYTDYRQLLEENELGLWSCNGDVETMVSNIKRFTEDKAYREHCGNNARAYLCKNATAENSYEIIMKSTREGC